MQISAYTFAMYGMMYSSDEKKQLPGKPERLYGIDLLRILSMFFIVNLHVLGQGGAMLRVSTHPQTYYAAWLLETAAICAVNCYGLISGYIGVQSRFRLSRIIVLWLQVLFWSAGIALVFSIVRPETMRGIEVPENFMIMSERWYQILRYLMPVSFKTYWYFSAYTGVFFLAPFLNRAMRSFSAKEAGAALGILFVVFTVLPMVPKVFGLDYYEMIGGYSLIWLVILYLMGGCIRRMQIVMTTKKTVSCILLYCGCVFVSWGYKILVENATRETLGKAMYGRMLVTYHAPTITLCGICLLLLCKDLRIRNRVLRRIIMILSPVSFCVYVIHTHPLIWEHLLKKAFSSFSAFSPLLLLAATIGTALAIFLACSAIAWIREGLFRALNISRHCAFFDKLFTRKFDGGNL